MKTKAVIRGMTIELQALTYFPDGQEVAVEISLLTSLAVVAYNLDPSQYVVASAARPSRDGNRVSCSNAIATSLRSSQ